MMFYYQFRVENTKYKIGGAGLILYFVFLFGIEDRKSHFGQFSIFYSMKKFNYPKTDYCSTVWAYICKMLCAYCDSLQ